MGTGEGMGHRHALSGLEGEMDKRPITLDQDKPEVRRKGLDKWQPDPVAPGQDRVRAGFPSPVGTGLAHSDPGSEALHAAQLYCPGPFPLQLSWATVLCFLLKLSHIPHPLCLLLQQENGTTQKRGPIDALPAVPMCSAHHHPHG